VSAARLGLPDTGLISFSEMLDTGAQLLRGGRHRAG